MTRLLLTFAFLAFAIPAHAEMEGPFAVQDLASCATSGTPAITTCTEAAGLHYIVSAGFYAAHSAALAPYRDAVQANLQNVYAGDDPAQPKMTVSLTFPDQQTVDRVKLELVQ